MKLYGLSKWWQNGKKTFSKTRYYLLVFKNKKNYTFNIEQLIHIENKNGGSYKKVKNGVEYNWINLCLLIGGMIYQNLC
jgi:hypothetical protein